jgi:hypothetical protein
MPIEDLRDFVQLDLDVGVAQAGGIAVRAEREDARKKVDGLDQRLNVCVWCAD